MSDTISWFEVPATDAGRARGFYGGLFGWSFAPFDDSEGGGDYQMTQEGGGAVYTNPEGKGLMVYFSTADLDASVLRIRELGGESGEPQEIPNMGRYATCTDTEGNAFGVFQQG